MVEGTIDLTQENVMSPITGVQGSKAILNLGHSRMRARYWRQLSDGSWEQTQPLPADPASINQYFAKGFRARPPNGEVKPVVLETVTHPAIKRRKKKNKVKKSLGEGQFSVKTEIKNN